MTPILQVRMDIAWCCIHTTRFDSCAHIRFISIALSDAASVLPTCHYCQTVVHASDTEYNNRTPDSLNLRRALRRSRPSAAHEQQEKLVQGLLMQVCCQPVITVRLLCTPRILNIIIALQIRRIYDVLYGDPDRPRHTNSRRSWSKVF